jgi:hypothetical protein
MRVSQLKRQQEFQKISSQVTREKNIRASESAIQTVHQFIKRRAKLGDTEGSKKVHAIVSNRHSRKEKKGGASLVYEFRRSWIRESLMQQV